MSSLLNFGVVKFGNYMVSARFVLAWALASCSLGCRECALHRTPSHGTLHKKAFDLLPHVRIICCIVKLPTMCLCVCVYAPFSNVFFLFFGWLSFLQHLQNYSAGRTHLLTLPDEAAEGLERYGRANLYLQCAPSILSIAKPLFATCLPNFCSLKWQKAKPKTRAPNP